MPDRARFCETLGNASKTYKAEFLAKERLIKMYGMQRINTDPQLAQRFYESRGRTTTYEHIFHGLGQSTLLQQLHKEIKEELE